MDFEELYQRYFRDVYYFCRRFPMTPDLAEEITQETFFKAFKNLASYQGEKDIRAWLFTIARNTYYSYYRKQRRQRSFLQNSREELQIPDSSDRLEIKEEQLLLREAIGKMEERYQEVVALRVFGEMSFEQIGRLTHQSTNAARVTFFRGKKKLMTILAEEA